MFKMYVFEFWIFWFDFIIEICGLKDYVIIYFCCGYVVFMEEDGDFLG